MLEALQNQFYKNFEERGEIGASLSIWQNGEQILSLHHGWREPLHENPWTADTVVPVWSATKGPAAISYLLALHLAGLSPHDPVSEVWPELRAARNTGLSFVQLLSHQSGLAALSSENRPHILSRQQVIVAMEQQKPFWTPGKAHGYHPRTLGFLLDEIVRRLHGVSLGQLWKSRIAEPFGIDFWIGDLPLSVVDRLATIVPPKSLRPAPEEIAFYQALTKQDSLSSQAFSSPAGMRTLGEINRIENLQAGFPAFGGVGTAEALAKFYQILVSGGRFSHTEALPSSIVHTARELLVSGMDRALLLETAFTGGFQRDPLDASGKKRRQIFGPHLSAFGQPGAGGSHAFADPESGISFAYVMNQMESGLFPNRKSLDLVDLLYAE